MVATAMQSQIDAANAYEQLFVPCLLREWAPRVADAAKVRSGQRVLDVACGTGLLTREVASRVAPNGSVVGLDLNPGMLTVAERLAPSIEWHEGTAESLPFPDESFDVVVSQFGLMFFGDRQRALREMIRVLRSGGRLAVAVWGELDDAPAYAVEEKLIREIAGTEAALPVQAPFALGDAKELVALFERAGVASVSVASHVGTARFPSIGLMVGADLHGWLPLMGVVLPEEKSRAILESAEQALAPYVTADGSVVSDMPAHIVTGRRPEIS
ncbi:MAG TPA: class I SAM-dependent methyltransferase [Gemmatimonadaceae bacterium]|nr:class I SAM-dependent methyltransferase [Gemmatimonadaceae bacterium]